MILMHGTGDIIIHGTVILIRYIDIVCIYPNGAGNSLSMRSPFASCRCPDAEGLYSSTQTHTDSVRGVDLAESKGSESVPLPAPTPSGPTHSARDQRDIQRQAFHIEKFEII